MGGRGRGWFVPSSPRVCSCQGQVVYPSSSFLVIGIINRNMADVEEVEEAEVMKALGRATLVHSMHALMLPNAQGIQETW